MDNSAAATVSPTSEETEWEVMARFRSHRDLDRAIERLKSSGFDHGSLAMPETNPPEERATPEAGSEEISTESGAQQRRTLVASVLGAAAAMIGALIAATKGGSMAAIGGAAFGFGIVVAVIALLIGHAISRADWKQQGVAAAQGTLVLAVRTDSEERRERALAVLRETGGEPI